MRRKRANSLGLHGNLAARQGGSAMKKIALYDIARNGYEPYDRQYLMGQVADCCRRNPSILRNAGMTTVMARGYLAHESVWEDREKPVSVVCFEIDELTDAKREFLLSSIGSWAVKLGVLPDDWETTVIYPSEFKK